VIDAAVKIQDERLRYIREHRQDTLLRSESARQLRDHIAAESEKVGKSVGRISILPVDFPGSEKFTHQQYLDAMAIVTTYRVFQSTRPPLFYWKRRVQLFR